MRRLYAAVFDINGFDDIADDINPIKSLNLLTIERRKDRLTPSMSQNNNIVEASSYLFICQFWPFAKVQLPSYIATLWFVNRSDKSNDIEQFFIFHRRVATFRRHEHTGGVERVIDGAPCFDKSH